MIAMGEGTETSDFAESMMALTAHRRSGLQTTFPAICSLFLLPCQQVQQA